MTSAVPIMIASNLGRIAMLLAVIALLSSCSAKAPPVPEGTADRARAALMPFKKGLSTALVAALQDGGPEEAIRVCRLDAPKIAAAASNEDVEIGRTSHRIRNPENAAPPWTAPLLDEYRATPSDTTSRVVRLDAEHVGYVEPIHVKPLCLTCHGEEIAEPVRDRLRELYPDDAATGFQDGDFRGLFWVNVKLRESA